MRYDLKIPTAEGIHLECIQRIPSKGDVFPTIVLVPGFGVDLHEYGYFDEAADMLVKYGFQTIQFSFSGTGGSEGEFTTTTIDREAQELQAVLQYVVKDRFTDTANIGILAHSFGGDVVVASLPLPMVKTFIFSSVPADPRTSLEKYFRQEHKFNPEGISSRQRSDGSVTKIGPQFWHSLERHHFVNESKAVTQPILLLYGEKDNKFNANQGRLYFEEIKSRKRFLLLEKADHSFTREFRTKALELIAEWFNENCV